MAPKGKDTPLEICTSTITLGNSIAVHMLDYLSVVKDPPHGFNKLAVEFIETSRVLIPAKTGLTEQARSLMQLALNTTNELKERFRQVNTAFTVLNQVVNRFLDNERKQGFSRIGKGFRMMFADGEIDKLRLTLVQCRDSLLKNPQIQSWTLGENQIEPAAGIGYTALAAVLDRPDPTRGRSKSETPSLHNQPITDSPPELPPLPSGPMLERYATTASERGTHSMSSRLDRPSPGFPESAFMERDRMERDRGSDRGGPPSPPYYSRESSKLSDGSHGYSTRSSGLPLTADNLSEITAPTSMGDIDEIMYATDLEDKTPNQAVRVNIDPSKVPRWRPKRNVGTVSAAQKTGLLNAVQTKNVRAAGRVSLPGDVSLACLEPYADSCSSTK